jgi:O-methyltransferase
MKYREDYVSELVRQHKRQMDLFRELKYSRNVDGVTHQQIIPYATYSPWFDDRAFLDIFERVRAFTLVDIYRCYELWTLVKGVRDIDGDILEVGVWRGGTGAIIGTAASRNPNARVYLADTFEGVVKASEKDTIYKGGEHSDTNLELVLALIDQLKLVNIRVLKGIFPDEVNLDETSRSLKFCHIDVDTYDSAKDIFEYVWPKLASKGVVVFDDFGFWGCEGVTRFCNETRPIDSSFIHNINGHGIYIKH